MKVLLKIDSPYLDVETIEVSQDFDCLPNVGEFFCPLGGVDVQYLFLHLTEAGQSKFEEVRSENKNQDKAEFIQLLMNKSSFLVRKRNFFITHSQFVMIEIGLLDKL